MDALGGAKFFNFMQFLGKFGKIVCRHPPHTPPRRNPGSATADHPLGNHGSATDCLPVRE